MKNPEELLDRVKKLEILTKWCKPAYPFPEKEKAMVAFMTMNFRCPKREEVSVRCMGMQPNDVEKFGCEKCPDVEYRNCIRSVRHNLTKYNRMDSPMWQAQFDLLR